MLRLVLKHGLYILSIVICKNKCLVRFELRRGVVEYYGAAAFFGLIMVLFPTDNRERAVDLLQ